MSDQDLEYRLKDTERLIQRLQQDSDNQRKEYDAKLEKVQAKVSTLEATRTVLIALAAIFGIAGAWGAITLQTAQGKISAIQASVADTQAKVDQLQKGTQVIFDAENEAVSEARSSIQTAAREAAQHAASQIASEAPSIARMQCEIQKVYKIADDAQDEAHGANKEVDILFKTAEAATEANRWRASAVKELEEHYNNRFVVGPTPLEDLCKQ